MSRGISLVSDTGRSVSLAGSLVGDVQENPERYQLVAKETVEEGSIKLQIYVNYFKHIGCLLTFSTLLFYISFRTLDITNGIWLSSWSQDNDTSPANRDFLLGVYAGIGLSQGLCNFFGVAFLTKATITASTNLHRLMLHSIMRAPLSFFDTTPMGRLLNRFGKDLDQLDVQLPMMANFTLEMFFQIIGMVVLISMKFPVFLLFAIPVLTLFVILRQIFVKTLRQVKRLESVTRSPIYSHFSETINGLTSVRGFGVEDVFRKKNDEKVDISQNCSFHVTVCNYWMSLRLELLGNIMIFVMVVLVVTNRQIIDAGTAGLLISYSLGAVVAFNFFVFFSTEVESTIIAAERLDEYTNVEPEALWSSNNRPSDDWPGRGEIEFRTYSTRYRNGLNLILHNINLTVQPLQKIGVVGRTGAGKSTLILTIFRILEGVEGKIFIDGVDIGKIGLHELRSRLTIIPQESVLFCSSLRFNLDPNDEYTDAQLWTALERAHLKQYFEGQNGLETEISEGGGNLSVGQRQLVCLARAVLRKTRILVLDEATAAVDLETDTLIQDTIRKVFRDSTILTIAHRVNTILDSDLVVVMAAGQIIETGQPQVLLQNPQSEFFSMAREAGLALTSAVSIAEKPIDWKTDSTASTSTSDNQKSSQI
ncbi:canalicular multispecific organic anion transporter 1-like [Tropilaelaps mercedesae]|uniref:Canalicular multispecific organic anion transporter 1-like n=1 Tax=Tropilaelaps mercedesae TaxID=418985 RepID=A0A1V9XCM1_9ACAR|nr:canalicular multispecific organic anion transporter 1-like [Tropilaelaps mercedesae]